MTDVAIRVEGLGKRYRIGAKQEKYKTLRDTLTDAALSPFRRVRALASRNGHSNSESTIRNSKFDTIWALKDVSFEVKRGEVIGVIGRNGAGKSTLLKILSRITEPTEGYADICGRVGSLLEVGTGFHPELTGRENIYLNGSILGMKRAEIQNKFDEIVAFAEIEKFIETAVKHYSSGMYVRLAFAVAAHLEPEILLVDEVLAVGDAAFQKKCLGKMSDVAKEGRTVLFVSHNMGAIQSLCSSGLLLNAGTLESTGVTDLVVRQYNQANNELVGISIANREDRTGSGEVRCTRIRFLDSSQKEIPFLYPNEPCSIKLDYEAKDESDQIVKVGLGIDTVEGVRLLTLYSDLTGESFRVEGGAGSFVCTLPEGLRLRPDIYLIHIFVGTEFGTVDLVLSAATVEIRDTNFYGTGKLPYRAQGPILLSHSWAATTS